MKNQDMDIFPTTTPFNIWNVKVFVQCTSPKASSPKIKNRKSVWLFDTLLS